MALESTPVIFNKSCCCGFLLLAFLLLSTGTPLPGQSPSPLVSRGYAVLPVPQKVTLTGKDFELDNHWKLQLVSTVKENDVAVESLQAGLGIRFYLSLAGNGFGPPTSGGVQLDPRAKSGSIGEATDRSEERRVGEEWR